VTATAIRPALQLADEIANFYADSLGFVRFAYPWGERGPLADYDGPDVWQAETTRPYAQGTITAKSPLPQYPLTRSLSAGETPLSENGGARA
jgi:hypothetical protein